MVSETVLFITLLIFSPLLLFVSYFMLLYIIYNKTDYKIYSIIELIKNIILLVIFVAFLYFLFSLRRLRKNWVLDLKKVYVIFKSEISELLFADILLLSIFAIILLFFVMLFIMLFYKTVKIAATRLLLYLQQYEKLKRMPWHYVDFITDSLRFKRFVSRFTKNKKLLYLAFLICPKSWNILETVIFFGILPYLIYFDILTNDARITKIFVIMPWYFLYSLWRSFNNFLSEFYRSGTILLAVKLYL
jgi:hypothetical protein